MNPLIPPINTADSMFHDGNPATGELGTIVSAEWLNNMQGALRGNQSELIALLTAAGAEPNTAKVDQVLTALRGLFLGKTALAADSAKLEGHPADYFAKADEIAKLRSEAMLGSFKNLRASSSGTNSVIAVSVDAIAVEDSSNTYKTLRTVSLLINSAASGANGLDTGSLAGSTWYSVWVIYNPTTQTTAGLLSLSSTAPTMPSGYTMKARVGWVRTDGTANKYPLFFQQNGRRVRYRVGAGTNVTAYPTLASGVQGNVSTPTWVAVGISALVPQTATLITVLPSCQNTANASVLIAPNAGFGAINSALNCPPVAMGTPAGMSSTYASDIQIESSNIYVAHQAAQSLSQCVGWEDNI